MQLILTLQWDTNLSISHFLQIILEDHPFLMINKTSVQ